jgi:hypothetical protein
LQLKCSSLVRIHINARTLRILTGFEVVESCFGFDDRDPHAGVRATRRAVGVRSSDAFIVEYTIDLLYELFWNEKFLFTKHIQVHTSASNFEKSGTLFCW